MKITFTGDGIVTYDSYLGETVTVKALIEALQRCDLSATVVTEGCDCDGNVISLETRDNGSVYLRRSA